MLWTRGLHICHVVACAGLESPTHIQGPPVAPVNNMVDIERINFQPLEMFLNDRFITTTGYKKDKLCVLARKAVQHYVQPKAADDHEDSLAKRRKLQGGEMPPTDQCTFSKDLTFLPGLDLVHVTVYLASHCKWPTTKLGSYQKNKSCLLFKDRHIMEVEISQRVAVGSEDHVYVKGSCRPQTRQSAQPYSTWVLMSSACVVNSASCSCTAG